MGGGKGGEGESLARRGKMSKELEVPLQFEKLSLIKLSGVGID